jgi:hypothetical protein
MSPVRTSFRKSWNTSRDNRRRRNSALAAVDNGSLKLRNVRSKQTRLADQRLPDQLQHLCAFGRDVHQPFASFHISDEFNNCFRLLPLRCAVTRYAARFTNRWFMLRILATAHHCGSVGENAESISISGRRHIEGHPTEQTDTLIMDHSVWLRRQAA